MATSSLGRRQFQSDSSEHGSSPSKRLKPNPPASKDAQEINRQADWHKSQGRLRRACELKLQAAQIEFGDMDQNTFRAMYTLAHAYFSQGLFQPAATLQLQALSRQKRIFGSNHLDTVQGMHELALTYIEQKKYNEAEQLERRVVFVCSQVLGKANRETLCAMRQLMVILRKQHRVEDAQQLEDKISQLIRKQGLRNDDSTPSLLPLVSRNTRRSEPVASEIEKLAQTALEEAMSHFPSRAPSQPAELDECDTTSSLSAVIGQDVISERLATQTERCIGTKTSMQDVLKLLVKAQCQDLSEKIDEDRCPKAPHAGGRFGDVWRGELADRTQVAIKCLRLHTGSEDKVKNVKRAARELYYWSKAKHSNVLELMGIGIFKGRLAMISPWMANGTLHAYINKYPEANRWALCEQVAEGLSYVHEIQMVHGDLKAVNILVSSDGVVKLSDFGNAILSDHSLAFTATTNIGGGTSRWMAPELLHEEDEEGDTADRSMPADVYALGMTILEVVTGDIPYAERKTDAWVIQAVTEGILPQRPTQFSSQVRNGDRRWEMLIECWSTKPRDRPTSMMIKHKAHALA